MEHIGFAYLDFDRSEDEHGLTTFDAMASVESGRWSALQDEITRVLGWACQEFAGRQGALEDGGEWDYCLNITRETCVALAATFDARQSELLTQDQAGHTERYSVNFTVCGSAAFAEAFENLFLV